jgi:hypothetical protein
MEIEVTEAVDSGDGDIGISYSGVGIDATDLVTETFHDIAGIVMSRIIMLKPNPRHAVF